MDIDEPLREPMKSLSIRTTRGGGVEAIDAPELNLPTLRFSVSTGVGRLEFSDLAARGGTHGVQLPSGSRVE